MVRVSGGALACVFVLASATSVAANASRIPVVHPAGLTYAVMKYPNLSFPVVVTARPDASMDVLQDILSKGVDKQYSFRLPLIKSVAVSLRGDELNNLFHNNEIERIWYYVHTANFLPCVRVVKAISEAINDGNDLINISAQAPERSFDGTEPVNAATHVAFDKGVLVTVAAGNTGPAPGSLNAWCSPWVVCVGATSMDGRHLASFSARAAPHETISLPTVVATGVEIWPPRSHTVTSGTSFAAPKVTGIEALLLQYVAVAILDAYAHHRYTFEVTYKLPLNRVPDVRTTSRRVVGRLRWNGRERVVEYPAALSPALLQQMIMDLAVGVEHYDSTAIGAGFVDKENFIKVFGRDPRSGKPFTGRGVKIANFE